MDKLLGTWTSFLGLGLGFWTLDKKSGPWIRNLGAWTRNSGAGGLDKEFGGLDKESGALDK